jgi:hypothetical protein
MQKNSLTKVAVMTVLLAGIWTARANAECGDISKLGLGTNPVQRQAWRGLRPSQMKPLLVSESRERIVGLWKVIFTSEGTDGIPDGTVIDSAFAQWHSDGTEIMNSSRSPVTQSFCLGVWKETGESTYKLNHFAISWDQKGNLVGPANIREEVTLEGREHFTGTFTIDQYDQAGNLLAHLAGVLTGTRITVDSPSSVAF